MTTLLYWRTDNANKRHWLLCHMTDHRRINSLRGRRPKTSEEEGKGEDERVEREKIGRGRIVVRDASPSPIILTFLPFYGLPRWLSDQQIFALSIIGQFTDINNIMPWLDDCFFFCSVNDFLQCDPFFQIWPAFPNVTHFLQRDPFFSVTHTILLITF